MSLYKNVMYDCVNGWVINKGSMNVSEAFKILQLNIRGMNDLAKFDRIAELIRRYGYRIDIVVLGETWIKQDKSGLYKLDGYKGIFSCRNDSNGGLAVFVRSDLDVDVRQNRTVDGFHHISCAFYCQGKPIDMHAVYRPPSFDTRRFLHEIEGMIAKVRKGSEFILVGDINIPTNLPSNNVVGEYLRLLTSHNTFVTNTNVTRPDSRNILDHVVCSELPASSIVNETVVDDISDHCMILTSIKIQRGLLARTLQKQIVDHRRLNSMFADSMRMLPESMHGSEKLNYVISSYNSILAQCTKTVTIQAKLKGHCPWMTIELWKLIQIKDNLLKRKRRHPEDQQAVDLLHHVSKLLQKKKALCKRNYYFNLLERADQRKAWKIVNNTLGKQDNDQSIKTVTSNGRTITDPVGVCEAFNEFFCNVGSDLAASIISDKKHPTLWHIASTTKFDLLNTCNDQRSNHSNT